MQIHAHIYKIYWCMPEACNSGMISTATVFGQDPIYIYIFYIYTYIYMYTLLISVLSLFYADSGSIRLDFKV